MKKIYEIINKYKGYLVCIVIIILASLSILVQNYEKNTDKSNISSLDICVYVIGEVNSPGVYYIKKNSRLCDLLDICGGITQNADLNKLNMAKLINDGDKIEIPKIQIMEEETLTQESNKENSKVNINTASKEELMTLTSIGSSTADKIIKYRQEMTFETIEDIMNVSGIGESKYNKIKDSITVD